MNAELGVSKDLPITCRQQSCRPILPDAADRKLCRGRQLSVSRPTLRVIGRFCLSFFTSRTEAIGGAADAPVQNMGVDHRRFHVAVPQQFLHRANVVAVGQQVGR
jgi:hypothetical protein